MKRLIWKSAQSTHLAEDVELQHRALCGRYVLGEPTVPDSTEEDACVSCLRTADHLGLAVPPFAQPARRQEGKGALGL